jgi:hypothetical protein
VFPALHHLSAVFSLASRELGIPTVLRRAFFICMVKGVREILMFFHILSARSKR